MLVLLPYSDQAALLLMHVLRYELACTHALRKEGQILLNVSLPLQLFVDLEHIAAVSLCILILVKRGVSL